MTYWSDGTPYVIEPGEQIFIPKQWEFIDSLYKYDAVLYGGSAGSGKALDIDTPLPTPTGWTTMGEVQFGDYLIDDQGNPAKVIATSAIQEQESFRVTFNDGVEIIASGDHLWETSTYSERLRATKCTEEWRANRRANRKSRGTGKRPDLAERNKRDAKTNNLPTSGIRTTNEIRETLYVEEDRVNHSVRIGGALQLPQAQLPIEPYTLGAWLGDGTSSTGAVSGLDEGVFEQIINDGYEVGMVPSSKGMTRRIPGFTKKLQELGVLNNKHIPMTYQRSSIEQRLALLQGLMDTDGHCDKSGCVEFVSTNKTLFDDVRQIVISLGLRHGCGEGKATLNGRYISPKYSLILSSCHLPLFRLERKLKRQRLVGQKPVRYITSVESVGIRKVKCVGIDSPSHLYRAGTAMVPTHNTYILLWSLVWILMRMSADFKRRGIKVIPRVVMFNATYNDVDDRHIKELPNYFPDWLGTVYASKPPEYHLNPEFGSGQILFRNLSNPDQYKSVQFGAIAFEEITENEEHVFKTIMLRKRFPGVEHIPVLAATNPTGPGRAWVYRMFVDPETKELPGHDDVHDHDYLGFHYIQALPTDNPTLAKAYLHDLNSADDKDRRAYYLGDWGAFKEQFFDLVPELHRFSRDIELPDEWPEYRAIDAGYGHPTVCLWGKVDFEGTLWVHREYSVSGHYAEYHKKHIAALSVDQYGEVMESSRYVKTLGDPAMWKGDKSSASNVTWREIFNAKDDIGSFEMVKARAAGKEDAWALMLNAFGCEFEWYTDKDGIKRRKILRYPKIRISEDCKCLWKSLTSRSRDDKNSDVVKKTQGMYKPGEGDDETDTLRYLFMGAIKGRFTDDEITADYNDRKSRITSSADRFYAQNSLSQNPFAN